MPPVLRRKSATVKIGNVHVGSSAQIVVQSMTNTDTADVESTVQQIAVTSHRVVSWRRIQAPEPTPMRIPRIPILALACLSFLPGSPTAAAITEPVEFPLRVHIYHVSSHSHRWRGMVEWVGGEGRANLYENGMPAGLEFTYHCGEKFMHSEDYETIPARWKRPGYSLIVAAHPIGSDRLVTCEWKVDVKDFAYARVNGHVITEPAADLQHWMQVHQYDPEHSDAPPADIPYNGNAHP